MIHQQIIANIYSTDKFLCSGNNINCEESKYTNIGLINIEEYNKIGGKNSYLGSSSSYFSMTENNNLVSNITSNGIEEVEFDTISGLRGVVYIQEDVKVTGKGTVEIKIFIDELKKTTTQFNLNSSNPVLTID